jgi:hypothetical protein
MLARRWSKLRRRERARENSTVPSRDKLHSHAVPPPAARGPSPRPPACGWGCARGGGRCVHGWRGSGAVRLERDAGRGDRAGEGRDGGLTLAGYAAAGCVDGNALPASDGGAPDTPIDANPTYNGSAVTGDAPVMPRTSPWYSAKESYHHDNTECGPGSEILQHNRIAGTGGKPLCPECARLDFGIPENLPGYARQK